MLLTCPHCNTAATAGDAAATCAACGGSLVATVGYAPPAGHNATVDYSPRTAGTQLWSGAVADTADVPDVIGGYRVVRVLGRGGMGRVFECEDPKTGRRVAIKLLTETAEGRPDAIERFRLEARLAVQVGGPRVVFVLAFGDDAGRPFIVMDLMPGDTLHDAVARGGPRPVGEAVEAGLDVLDGLAAAHAAGVVHRDVKPGNCFLERDRRVKVGDFGLAQALAATPAGEGRFVGTPHYAAPEQAAGEPTDARTDQYALAATLYFLLTGQPPVARGKVTEVLAWVIAGDIRPLRDLRPDVPAALAVVVHRGLAREPAARWPDLHAFRRQLVEFAPARLQRPGWPARIAAMLVEYVPIATGLTVLGWVLHPLFGSGSAFSEPPTPAQQTFLNGMIAVTLLVYFGLTEGVGDRSLGKRLVGLRVRATDGRPLSVRHTLSRHLVFALFLTAPGVVAAVVTAAYRSEAVKSGWLMYFDALLSYGGLFVFLLPMLLTRSRRGWHEFASGTQVVAATPESPTPAVELAGFEPTDDRTTPRRVGPFDVFGTLSETAATTALLGIDAVLGRRVLILLAPPGLGNAPDARRTITSANRLRWLVGGTTDGRAWDAYTAPEGEPLARHVDRAGQMAWGDGRAFLAELTCELTAAVKGGALPVDVSEDQVWVRLDGRPLLLDVPAGPPTAAPVGGADADRAVGLLRRVAGLVVEGAPRPAEGSESPVAARLPRRAERAVAALFRRSDDSRATLRAWLDDLGKQLDRPVAVSRAGRMLGLLLQGVVAAFVLSGVTFMSGVFELTLTKTAAAPPDDGTVSAAVRAHADLKLALTGLNPDPWVRLTGPAVWRNDYLLADRLDRVSAARRDHPPDLRDNLGPLQRLMWDAGPTVYQNLPKRGGADARADAENRLWIAADSHTDFRRMLFVISAAGCGLVVGLWMFLAFVSRGGLFLRTTGAAVVRHDGRPAGRFRCATRTLVSWLPFLGLLLLSLLVKLSFPITERLPWWALWASVGLWWLGFAVLFAQFAQIVRRPDRSFADRVVGTWLVPN